jgi:hypothetical protein
VTERLNYWRSNNPGSSVIMLCECQEWTISGRGTEATDFCECCGNRSYKVYMIPYNAGRTTVVLKGDGGFINCAFAGQFDRPGNGKTVIFKP